MDNDTSATGRDPNKPSKVGSTGKRTRAKNTAAVNARRRNNPGTAAAEFARVNADNAEPIGTGRIDDSSSTPTNTHEQEKRAESQTQETIFLEPPENVKSSKQSKAKPGKAKQSTAKDANESLAAARALIETVELFAITRFGADGVFTVQERILIEKPLARTIEKYGGLADRYSGLLDPIMILIGCGIYAKRIVDASRQSPPPPPPKPQPPPPPPPEQYEQPEHGSNGFSELEVAQMIGSHFR